MSIGTNKPKIRENKAPSNDKKAETRSVLSIQIWRIILEAKGTLPIILLILGAVAVAGMVIFRFPPSWP